MQSYSYQITVIDGAGVAHKLVGTAEGRDPVTATSAAVAASFEKLTGGDTQYGHPGKGGCRGPYRIDRLELVRYGE